MLSRLPWSPDPRSARVHYAVLNCRDQAVLQGAGIEPDRLHLLPNPVTAPALETDAPSARAKLARYFDVPAGADYLLYPIRAIRRKNVGEALLIALLAETPTVVGVSLPAESQSEVARYRQWMDFAEGLRLSEEFEYEKAIFRFREALRDESKTPKQRAICHIYIGLTLAELREDATAFTSRSE